jgi:hypothetical protein
VPEHRAIGGPGADEPVAREVPRARLERRLRAAAARGGAELRARVRLALAELVALVDEDHGAARALLAGGCGERAAARREATMDRLVACLEETIASCPPPGRSASPLAAAAVVGGVERILQTRLHKGEIDPDQLLGALLYTTVLHLEGPDAARQALAELGAGARGGKAPGG